jgi:DNA-binding protein Fis
MNYKALLLNKQYDAAIKLVEKEVYLTAYKDSRYNQVKAAKALGVSRGTFRTRLAEYEGWAEENEV